MHNFIQFLFIYFRKPLLNLLMRVSNNLRVMIIRILFKLFQTILMLSLTSLNALLTHETSCKCLDFFLQDFDQNMLISRKLTCESEV